jgi:hypothetical protein
VDRGYFRPRPASEKDSAAPPRSRSLPPERVPVRIIFKPENSLRKKFGIEGNLQNLRHATNSSYKLPAHDVPKCLRGNLTLGENKEDLVLIAYSTSQTWSPLPESLGFSQSHKGLTARNSFSSFLYFFVCHLLNNTHCSDPY